MYIVGVCDRLGCECVNHFNES